MFTAQYFDFLKDLSRNNNTEWFNQNKSGFEQFVKKPFDKYIRTLINEIHQLTPEIDIESKDAIFRINKDIRFSADKAPYKTEMSALISKMGKKANPCPGLYLSLGAEKMIVACGLKILEKEELIKVRRHITTNLEEFNALLGAPLFKETFGEIKGDRVKRLPEEFKEAGMCQPLLYNTSFLAMTETDASEVADIDMVEKALNIYKVSLPYSKFLSTPLL